MPDSDLPDRLATRALRRAFAAAAGPEGAGATPCLSPHSAPTPFSALTLPGFLADGPAKPLAAPLAKPAP